MENFDENTKDLKRFLSAPIWYPGDARFRVEYERRLMLAIEHLDRFGDYTLLNRLIETCPEPKFRLEITTAISVGFGLKFLEKARAWKRDPQAINCARSIKITWKRRKLSSEYKIDALLGLTPSEFISDISDLLILNRDSLSADEIAVLDETISQLKMRQDCRPKNGT